MYSLTFLSAEQLVQDEEATCKMLESMPQRMFGILFKVAFRKNKTQLLCELVKMWPYSELKFLLQLRMCRHCSWSYIKCPECIGILTPDELYKNKIDAILLGVISYIRNIIMDGSQQLPYRRLQLLDMTGLHDAGITCNLKLIRLWVSSIRQARIYSSGLQSQSSPQVAEASAVTFPAETSAVTFPAEASAVTFPAEASAVTFPAEASAVTFPAEASAVTFPAEASAVTFPAEASAVTFPAEASAVTFPAEASAVTFPAEASAVTFPAEASAVTFPAEASAVTFPAEASAVTFPAEASVTLRVDLILCPPSADMLKELLQENTNSPLHLKCRDLYITFMFFCDMLRFLPILDPLELRRVDISHCFMTFEYIVGLMSHFTTFQNFQSFRMALNINKVLYLEPLLNSRAELLAAELRKFKWLKEIGLPRVCLSDQVKNLLGNLHYPLESLHLSSCSLTKEDLTYLARSHHSTHLVKLDLTDNDIIIQQLDIFLELLKSASKSLKWLNVAMCRIKDSDFYATLPYLYSCSKLSHLGLSDNPLSSKSIFIFLESSHHKLPNLKLMSLPVFLDCCQNLPQSLPRLLESYMNMEMISNVIKQMKQVLISRGDFTLELVSRFNFDVGDYFDL